MNKQELFDLLEMDSPADFSYYEQMAELLESDEDIPFSAFCSVLLEIGADELNEIIINYFTELTQAVPDNADDIVSLLENIKQQLCMHIEDPEDRDCRRNFAQELYKFREWLSEPDGASVSGRQHSVLGAITKARENKFTGEEDEFDFSNAMNYELDELVMNIGNFNKIDILGDEQ